MKYLLFINFNSGLMHNSIYNNLDDVCESIEQLIQDEKLNIKKGKMLTSHNLKRYLSKHDDYFNKLTNGTWYQVQSYPVFEV